MAKDRSPFSPGRPVPLEMFVGRKAEIDQILRAAGQVVAGKQENVFVTGEYGIGKSSFASLVRFVAEKKHNLVGFHVFLGSANTVEQMVEQVVSQIVRQTSSDKKTFEKVANLLGKYVEKFTLFGATVNLEALKKDAEAVAHNFLPFLRQIYGSLKDEWNGMMLILDDLNGITSSPKFAAMIKSLVDEIATSGETLSLLLMLTGVPERREEILQHQRSVERIFDVVEIDPLEDESVEEFFLRAFESVDNKLEPAALKTLTHYSGGLPKLMHEVDDATFWAVPGNVVTERYAIDGVVRAADNVGKKYFDQIYRALRSTDYHSILRKLGKLQIDQSFYRADAVKGLTQSEKRKFDNFLQRMKDLKALRSGEARGEWVFPDRLIRVYLLLESLGKKPNSST